MKGVDLDLTQGLAALRASLTGNDDVAIITAYHAWISAAVDQFDQRRVSCAKGCSFCCKQSQITINATEASILSRYTGLPARFSSRTDSVDRRGIPCPFLHDNICTVYTSRPAVCRSSVSFDDPFKCKTEQTRTMLVPESLYNQLGDMISWPEVKRLLIAMGNEADIRQFFA